ncbi:MAG: glycosyl hydrolase 53 family protein [Bacteroidales bacterium]|nr:glycosyl hydrolase 53 family protein [Bacteroidales bacterium]
MNTFCKIAAIALAGMMLAGCKNAGKQEEPAYWLGADISTANGMAARGQTLLDFEGDQPYELTELMHRMGLNAARYRVWVNPRPFRRGPRPAEGAQQEPEITDHAGMCDKEDLLANCLKAKALGMAIMVDFHYADSWADPGKQPIPEAWLGHDYETMKQDLYNHTVEVLQYLKDNGVTPKWVQIGNETSNGLLWTPKRRERGQEPPKTLEEGLAAHMGHIRLEPEQYAGFIQEGCKAAKSVFPDIITIVHLDNGYDQNLYDFNLGVLEQYGTQYDMVGMSLYPYWARGNGHTDADQVITDCIANIKHVYERFGKESMIVETGFQISNTDLALNEEGYRQLTRAIKESRDNTDGHCKGIFYWAPEAKAEAGYALGAFKQDGRPTKVMQAYVEAAAEAAARK